jgi:hypothetical protein
MINTERQAELDAEEAVRKEKHIIARNKKIEKAGRSAMVKIRAEIRSGLTTAKPYMFR